MSQSSNQDTTSPSQTRVDGVLYHIAVVSAASVSNLRQKSEFVHVETFPFLEWQLRSLN